jgi:hypothetical protein
MKKVEWIMVISWLSITVMMMWIGFVVGRHTAPSDDPVALRPSVSHAPSRLPPAPVAPTYEIIAAPAYVPPVIPPVSEIDRRVYREEVAAGCPDPQCDRVGNCNCPGSRCGPELLAWEHAVSPAQEELNCLYKGGTAKSCHLKPCLR